jgi:hypothetical protein
MVRALKLNEDPRFAHAVRGALVKGDQRVPVKLQLPVAGVY